MSSTTSVVLVLKASKSDFAPLLEIPHCCKSSAKILKRVNITKQSNLYEPFIFQTFGCLVFFQQQILLKLYILCPLEAIYQSPYHSCLLPSRLSNVQISFAYECLRTLSLSSNSNYFLQCLTKKQTATVNSPHTTGRTL